MGWGAGGSVGSVVAVEDSIVVDKGVELRNVC
jgi:hypothetical protein